MKNTSAVTIAGAVIASAIALHSAGASQSRNPPPSWNTWLASEAAGFSGVALIGRGDTIEVEMAFGLAGPVGSQQNATNTRFNLGSINKTFTAIAIAQLLEQGRLGLDDALIKHLPEYPDKDAARRISIRQLLTHRSGVAQFMRADFGDVSVAAMTKIVGDEPLAFEPGARQVYSNGGYVLLGRVIEIVSGKTYSEYVNDHVYRPAGMVASGFYRDGDRRDNIALPVTAAGAMRGAQPGMGSPSAGLRTGNSAGGGYSTAADLFRFARALCSGRLLNPTMTRYVLDGTFAEDPKWGFALREQIVGRHRFLGNGGGAPGVNAEFRFEPQGEYTVVVLSNSGPPSATTLLTAILARIAGVEPTASARTQPPEAPETPAGLRGEVEALHTEMISAFRDEPANVARYYTDDARILGGGRRYSGTEQVRAYFSQVPRGANWTLAIVDVAGTAAEPWVLGRSTLGREGTQGMTVDYLAVLRRAADGRLRYHIDMFTAGVTQVMERE